MLLEHQIRVLKMIYEGLCDTEDWSNDTEKASQE